MRHHTSEYGQGWATTIEQTVLDLAARPALGGLPDQARTAAQALLARCDHQLLEEVVRRRSMS